MGGPKNHTKALAVVMTLRRAEGVTGIGLLWAMHKHRIEPLKNWVHPIFEYSDRRDPTWESADELPEVEIQDRVASIIAHGKEVDMGGHP
ncbi:hypothetical protein BAE44_0023205 [Dichanthelium oligosanthes]|uniref:Uncharacterized protein n=1 Tax=Dichanthelium oligosanthes TaxID=888268 RepID=A0A1E5USB9_9POAL|nr:hypothetical protein BAE44_0023205 [Dichanthelium oligosanthes]